MDGFDTIAQQFVQFYYNTFDSDRGLLAALYREPSMLTFESTASKGVNDIIEKLQSLPFGKIIHQVATVDAQPSNESGGIIVMVTGALLVEGEEKPMSYSQVFQLLPDAGTYYVFNDIFKLVYPA